MTQTGVTSQLFCDCKTVFFSLLPRDIDETIRRSDEPTGLYADLQLIDTIGQAIDTYLDTDATELLLALCLEDVGYFINPSDDKSCIIGHLTASHVVYHLVYDDLHAYLEAEWEAYVYAKREENPK